MQAMKNYNKLVQFGEEVEGYTIPVLNEREIRAGAGIMFLALFIALMFILFQQDFLVVKYVIILFLTDFMVRVLVSPRFSPLLIMGRLIVGNQVPEYVGAPQKNFAWKIGLALSSLMFVLMVVLNSYSVITGITCLVCLVFLFFESAFGICLGCIFYGWIYKQEPKYCAGETCDEKQKEQIQKTSPAQLLILVSTVVFIVLTITFFNHWFREAPRNLNEIINAL
jgi:hypothetical protein